MSVIVEYPAISPEELATKLKGIAHMRFPALLDEVIECPRLHEMLWFIQAMSLNPGGLRAFSGKLLQRFSDSIGKGILPQGTKSKFSTKESKEICERIPYCWRNDFSDENAQAYLSVAQGDDQILQLREGISRLAHEVLYSSEEEPAPEFTREQLIKLLTRIALAELPAILTDMCVGPNHTLIPTKRAWFLPDLSQCLLLFMDEYAVQIKGRIAKTEITEKVFELLDYASSKTVAIRIEGAPRIGKTESASTWCEMYPGRARLVTVPYSNTEIDLFKAMADSLGVDYNLGVRLHEIRDTVQHVLKHSRMLIVLDEGHFLIPTRYTETTQPARLNWVRTRIIDIGLPCAIIVTPQSFETPFKKFVKKTNHRFDQFFGRTQSFGLPSELSQEDLMAVAKIHFPELDGPPLKMIIGAALTSEGFLKAVEQLAKRAGFLAERAGRRSISGHDVDTAIRDILPEAETAPQPVCRQPATREKKPSKFPEVRRNVTPETTLIPA